MLHVSILVDFKNVGATVLEYIQSVEENPASFVRLNATRIMEHVL